jgi:hypothetical protein
MLRRYEKWNNCQHVGRLPRRGISLSVNYATGRIRFMVSVECLENETPLWSSVFRGRSRALK